MMKNNNPFVGTNRIRFIGYDLSPSGRAPLCFTFTGSKGKKKNVSVALFKGVYVIK